MSPPGKKIGLTTYESVLKATRAADWKNRAVVQWFEQLVAELRQHNLLNQPLTQLSAAAMREDDFLVIPNWHRTRALRSARVTARLFGPGSGVR